MTKVISILGSCPYQGKTTMAVNFCSALMQRRMVIGLTHNHEKEENNFISQLELYDYYLIDSVNHNYELFKISNMVLIPINPCIFSIRHMKPLIEELNTFNNIKKPEDRLKVFFLWNRCERGENIDPKIEAALKEYGYPILSARINEHDIYQKSSENGKTIFSDGENIAVSEMNTVVEEIIARLS